MAENTGVISNKIIIDTTQATASFQTLRKEMQELKLAHEKALRSDDKATIFKGATQDVKVLQGEIARVTAEIAKLKSSESAMIPMSKPPDFTRYNVQLRALNDEAMKHYQIWKNTGDPSAKMDFNRARADFALLNEESKKFNTAIGASRNYFDAFSARVRSHVEWIVSGALIATVTALPMMVENIARETEVLGQKLKQNLELAERYHENMGALEGDIKHLGEVAATFAMGYGANVKDVMEMMQVLSRRFKSPEELTYYTNLALIMHKLDFVAPKKAAEDLEAVILSMGLDFHGAKRFIDEFSVAVHTARITGTELLSGLQRSGATMHNMNLNTAESIALISTLSTVTAKAGGNIGNSLNSILINVDFKKAAQALSAYQIQVYDANGEMRKGVEIWREIAAVFNGLPNDKANEFANAMSGGKFRANDLRALLGNWHEFEEILNNINTKASPELTASLLQTGMDTYDTKVKKLNASLQVMGVVIGNELLPMVKAMSMGLTEGVQWLNEHREAVAKVIKYIGLFTEALVLYKTQQILANSSLFAFIGTTKTAIATAPGFMGALRGMGASVAGFGKTIGATMLRMVAFVAAAEAIQRMYSGAKGDTTEKNFLSSIAGRNDLSAAEQAAVNALDERNRYIDSASMLNGDNGITGKWALYSNTDKSGQADKLTQIAEAKINATMKDKMMSNVEKMVAEAENTLANQGGKEIPNYADVAGQDIGRQSGKDTSKAEPHDTTVNVEDKVDLHEQKRRLAEILHNAKLAKDLHESVLDSIKTQEEIEGVTAYSVSSLVEEKQSQVKLVKTQNETLEAYVGGLEVLIDSHIATNDELRGKLASGDGKAYKDMDRKERSYQRNINSDLLSNDSALSGYMTLKNTAESKISENNKESVKNSNDVRALAAPRKPQDLYKENLERNATTQDILIAQNTDKLNLNNEVALNAIRLHKMQEDAKFHADELLRLDEIVADAKKETMKDQTAESRASAQNQLDIAQMAADKQRAIVAKNTQDIKDLEYAKDAKIKEGLAGIVDDVIVKGGSLKEIWGNLWNQLASDAIKALFKIQNTSGSLLGSIFGMLGGGVNLGGVAPMGVQGPVGSNGGFFKNFADGGLSDKPAIFGEAGLEMAIPMSPGKRSRALELYQQTGQMLGVGTKVVPNISPRTTEIAQNASLSNKEVIERLDRTNALLESLANITLNKEVSGGQGGILQPIVAPMAQGDGELWAQINRMRSTGYKV